MQGQRHGQGTAHWAQRARERQFTGKFVIGQARAVNLPTGSQNAQGNGQIQAPRVFGKVGRRQIDGDAFVVGKLQPGVLDCAAHPLARLFYLDISQAHQRKTGQTVGHMNFNSDLQGVKPQQDAALNQRQTHKNSLKRCVKTHFNAWRRTFCVRAVFIYSYDNRISPL